MENQCGST